MAPHGGFEGNGQTLRILTELIYERPGRTMGIAPTRALLDGVMKYKALHAEQTAAMGHNPEHHFIYDEQVEWRQKVFASAGLPESLDSPEALNAFKSIECQIMDWADDTAYSLHDIVDGIHARYITVGSLTEWAEARRSTATNPSNSTDLCEVSAKPLRALLRQPHRPLRPWLPSPARRIPQRPHPAPRLPARRRPRGQKRASSTSGSPST